MQKIQIIVIFINSLLLLYIARLIIKGKLREEYAIAWVVCTIVLMFFSFWRNGLEVLAKAFGFFEAPNLVFTAFIFIILIYLLHLSVVNTKLQKDITKLAQEIALMKQKEENAQNNDSDETT
ncbi:DUF2304 domain-containing protein [Emticicia sp. SJ17W-69]|uniref:DUF2304 domain-containing protein n=1 Tax=Emticicia sp. SJ17W-69 TaxID=3421657 RepID=UPI003EBE5639